MYCFQRSLTCHENTVFTSKINWLLVTMLTIIQRTQLWWALFDFKEKVIISSLWQFERFAMWIWKDLAHEYAEVRQQAGQPDLQTDHWPWSRQEKKKSMRQTLNVQNQHGRWLLKYSIARILWNISFGVWYQIDGMITGNTVPTGLMHSASGS